MLNPHWHGASLNHRCWYMVGWVVGLGIGLGLLLVVDYTDFQRWFRTRGGAIGAVRNRMHRAYGDNMALRG